jgi:hypothetical protein
MFGGIASGIGSVVGGLIGANSAQQSQQHTGCFLAGHHQHGQGQSSSYQKAENDVSHRTFHRIVNTVHQVQKGQRQTAKHDNVGDEFLFHTRLLSSTGFVCLRSASGVF